MFGSIAGLLVIGVVLIPGYAYNLIRRRQAPMARASRLMETMQVIVAAFVCTGASLVIFGLLRHFTWVGDHSPSTSALIDTDGHRGAAHPHVASRLRGDSRGSTVGILSGHRKAR